MTALLQIFAFFLLFYSVFAAKQTTLLPAEATEPINEVKNISRSNLNFSSEGESEDTIGLKDSEGVWCYLCYGYNPDEEEHSVNNNPYCAYREFSSDKVKSVFSAAVDSPFCFTLTVVEDDGIYTERGIGYATRGVVGELMDHRTRTQAGFLSGHYCYEDYCNQATKLTLNAAIAIGMLLALRL